MSLDFNKGHNAGICQACDFLGKIAMERVETRDAIFAAQRRLKIAFPPLSESPEPAASKTSSPDGSDKQPTAPVTLPPPGTGA